MKVREDFSKVTSSLWLCAKCRENKLDRSLNAAIRATPTIVRISAAFGALFEASIARAAVY
jgi:hypothetical protein